MQNKTGTQSFRLGHLLSVTTGRLVCEGENHPIDGVYKILNFLTGNNLYTHQLPSASRQCTPHILELYPQLTSVDLSHVTKDNWKDVMATLAEKYGDEFPLSPLPGDLMVPRTPFSDLPDKFLQGK